MNKVHSNQFRMFLSTQDFLNDHTGVWSAIPRVITYKNQFDELLARINDKAEEAGSVRGVGNRKDQLKKALAIKVSGLAGVLKAYSIEQGDQDLATAVSTSKTAILKMREHEIAPFAKKITSIAEEQLANLADFGITIESNTEILSTLEDFNSLIGKPRIILNQRYAALGSLDELISETSSLLRDKMDNVLLMFRESNPEFYDGYQRARTIVDL